MTGKEFWLYVHQLPQNIAGWCLTRKPRSTGIFTANDGEKVKVYFTSNVFNCGVSLGNYIILDWASYHWLAVYSKQPFLDTLSHEHGHQKQSKYLGWLYLLLIGLPSATGNIVDRVFHKKWYYAKRIKWYYKQPWEHWADKLGNVRRD